MSPADRRRGGITIVLVLIMSLCLGAVLLGSSAAVDPLHQRSHYLEASDEALALAEAGLEVARSELPQDPTFTGFSGVPLGRGHIDVSVERTGQVAVVRCVGRVPAPVEAGPDATLTRRIEVRLDLSQPGLPPRVLAWKEE